MAATEVLDPPVQVDVDHTGPALRRPRRRDSGWILWLVYGATVIVATMVAQLLTDAWFDYLERAAD